MTVKAIVNSVLEEDQIPDIIKHKLENLKTETRLNNKQIKLGENVVVISKNVAPKKLLKISLQIINYASLSSEPVIPTHGKLLTDIFQIDVLNNKDEIVPKSELNICFQIKCNNIDNYCYPMIYESERWSLLKQYELEKDYIKINTVNFDSITIVKEPPNDIINITPSGGLLYTKLDPLISLRVTKGNFKEEIMCKIQICNMSVKNLDQFKLIRDNDLSPYLNISNLFVIGISDSNLNFVNQASDFRRPITIRLPLPDWITSILEEQKFDSKTVIKDQKKEKIGFYFLYKSNDEWKFVESNLRFTKNSIEFDTKRFGSFLFVKCRENRELKLCQNLNLVESLIAIQNGIILTFLWIKTNNWFLWIEIVPISQIKETRSRLENLGFIYVEQYYEPVKLDDSKNIYKYKRKFSKSELIQRKTFELIENIQFRLKIIGEIEQSENFSNKKIESVINNFENTASLKDLNNFDELKNIRIKKQNVENEDQKDLNSIFDISYHANMLGSNFIVIPIKPIKRDFSEWESNILSKIEKQLIYENNTTFQHEEIPAFEQNNFQSDIDNELIVPISQESLKISRLSDEEKEFNFFSEIQLENVNSKSLIKIPIQKFRLYIPVDKMKSYHKIKSRDEKEKEKEKEKAEVETAKIQIKERHIETKILFDEQNQIEEKPKKINYNRINGLARPRFTNKMIEREPKIISRRSFLALSSVIRQGLKLAVYLSIPDNAIAGIGFDALSQMSMNGSNNTTYKILILWKKMTMYNKTKEKDYVEQLVYGLKSIGYENIGELVYDKWMNQQEITIDDCQRCLLQTIF